MEFSSDSRSCQHCILLLGKHGNDNHKQICLLCNFLFFQVSVLTVLFREPSSISIVSSLYSWQTSNFGIVMLLAMQNGVCLLSLLIAKRLKIISYRDFNTDEAKKCNLPCFLSSSSLWIKGLQFLSFLSS